MSKIKQAMHEWTGGLAGARLWLSVFVLIALFCQPSGAWGGVVAEVNGQPVTEMDVEEALQGLLPSAVFHGGITAEKRLKYRPEALARAVDEELLYQHALKVGLKADEKQVEALKEGAKERLGGSKAFKAALKEAGMSESDYEARLSKSILVAEALRVEVEEPSRMSEEATRAYYEANKGSYKRPEARVIRHILIKVSPQSTEAERKAQRDKAEGLLQQLKKGADFAQLAWDNSNDPYSVKGGLMGMMHKGMLEPAIEAEVWKLQAGGLTEVLDSIYGYHIVKVDEVMPTVQLGYEAVGPGIKSSLEKKNSQKLKDGLLTRLRGSATVVMKEVK